MFKTDLIVKEIDDRWCCLQEDFIYYSERYKVDIRVPRLFCTDYASVPRVPIFYMLCGGRGKKAATIHDFNYSRNEDKWKSDLMFKDGLCDTLVMPLIAKFDNGQLPSHERMKLVWKIRGQIIVCWMMWFGVFIGGWGTWLGYKQRIKKGLPLRPDAPDVDEEIL